MRTGTVFQTVTAMAVALAAQTAWAQQVVYEDPHTGERVEFDLQNPPLEFQMPPNPTLKHESKTTTFNVNFQDVVLDNNIGFDDPTLGANRQAIVLAVLDYIDAVLGENGACDIQFNASQTDGTGALAGANTLYFVAPVGFQPGVAFQHITTGIDVAGLTPDITATVDFGHNFNATLNAPTGTQYDLFSILLHELTHGLGMISKTSGISGDSSISGGNPGVYTTWDDLLRTGNGTDLWNSITTVFQTNASGMQGGANGIVFTGANATTAYGSNPPIFAPATFAAGSSLNHWDEDIVGGAVMTPSIVLGELQRAYADVEIAAFVDLGYVNAAEVPIVSLSATSYNTTESSGTVNVVINVSAAPGTTETVTVQTTTGTAGALDYTAVNESVDIGPTAASVSVPIAIANDFDEESAESFTVTISDPTGGIFLGLPTTATVTIAANDAPSENVAVVSQTNGGFVEEGTALDLNVVFSGITGSATYRWTKDGNDVVDGGSISGAETTLLTIDPVAPGDDGVYVLTGEDEAKGTFESNPITIVVVAPDSLPVAGIVGLGVLASACVAGGAMAFRRRK